MKSRQSDGIELNLIYLYAKDDIPSLSSRAFFALLSKEDSMTIPPLLNRHQVAEIFGISVSGLDKLCRKDSAFPTPRRFGRLLRWQRQQIEDYILGVAQASPAKPASQD
jgi:predicted DNA-binding transcriptional regulator AlpA